MQNYPNHWPKPNPHRPDSIPTKITDAQKYQLYNRQITSKSLAELFGVTPARISVLFPGRCPLPDKDQLLRARRLFRRNLAEQVLAGQLSVPDAAKLANVSRVTMFRCVREVKKGGYPIDRLSAVPRKRQT